MISNNLNKDEKLSVIRFNNHDVRSQFNRGYEEACIGRNKMGEPNFETIVSSLDHSLEVWNCIDHLMTKDKAIYSYSEAFLERTERLLKRVFEGKSLEVNFSEKRISSESFLIYPLLFNFVKNSFNYGAENVSVDLEESDFPNQALHIPRGAKQFSRFYSFKVQDDGRGFPEDFDYKNTLTVCPKSRGFGLYFTGLVSKVLRAPVDIQSERGDTKISFYHPIYKSD